MKNMSNITLAQLPVAIPEIAEQRRIVAILDEAFEAIAAAKARVEESLEKLDELFENAMRWVLKHPGVHLTHIAMGEVCEIRSKLVDPREDPYLDQPHVGAGNITSKTGELVDVLTARQEQLISGKFEFDDSMVLYSKIRPYLMKVVRPDFSGLCSADVYPLVPKPGVITRDFLYYTLLSSVFTDYAIKGSARVGMPKVNRDHLFAYQMSLPSVEVQGQITQKLDALSDNVKKVRGIYTRKLAALDELKKSLLDQAFSGQLTSSKPLPVVQPQALQTATPQFTANVIALAYTRHEKQKREKTFGHVKEQKVLHLVEAIAKVDLGRHPMKDAAGPNDFPHMLRAEQWAKEQSFFEMVERDKGYDFKRLKDFDKCLARARQELGPYLSQIEAAIDLLVPMDTEEAEVFVTVHAAWNNLLMDGAEATDSAILREARDTWHPAKLAIAEHKFKKAIKLVRRKNLVPDGTGKYVAGQKSLPL